MKKPPASIFEVRKGTSSHGRQRPPPGPAAGPQAPKPCPVPKPPRGKARAGRPTLRPAMGSTHCPLRPPPAAPQDSVCGSLRRLLGGAGRPSRTDVFAATAKQSECRALLRPPRGARTAPPPPRDIRCPQRPHAPHLEPPTHPCRCQPRGLPAPPVPWPPCLSLQVEAQVSAFSSIFRVCVSLVHPTGCCMCYVSQRQGRAF